jgi:hypothetical protein
LPGGRQSTTTLENGATLATLGECVVNRTLRASAGS